MKKFFAFVLAIVMVTSLFAGCGHTNATSETTQVQEQPDFKKSDLAWVPGYDDYLVYSITTRSVYYMFYAASQSFMAPYIINGHFCEYVDGEIVEVIPTVRIENATD